MEQSMLPHDVLHPAKNGRSGRYQMRRSPPSKGGGFRSSDCPAIDHRPSLAARGKQQSSTPGPPPHEGEGGGWNGTVDAPPSAFFGPHPHAHNGRSGRYQMRRSPTPPEREGGASAQAIAPLSITARPSRPKHEAWRRSLPPGQNQSVYGAVALHGLCPAQGGVATQETALSITPSSWPWEILHSYGTMGTIQAFRVPHPCPRWSECAGLFQPAAPDVMDVYLWRQSLPMASGHFR